MARATFRFTPGERHIFRRRPMLAVSRWAAANVVVPDGPYAGSRYRRDVNPYLAEIMDTWGQPGVEEVAVCGAPQTGKTLAMDICLLYSIDMRPGPRMLAMPDDETLDRIHEAKLKPIIRSCAPVRALLAKIKAGRVNFRDGTKLYLSSAQSPGQRASLPIQDLFLDEEDLYKQLAGKGVPVLDFLERQRSYSHKRKTFRGSKPVGDEAASSIWAAVQSGVDELRRYEARCPACMQHQRLEESGLMAIEGCKDPQEIERRRLARYKCAACGFLWTDHTRDVAVGAGRWRAEEPVDRPRKVGFHLPAILSARVSLSEILAAKLRAEATDSPDVIQAYRNGMWAEPYKPVVVVTSAGRILERRDPDLPARTVPAGFLALTAGVDMQKRYFWYSVCGWDAALNCAVIDYGRLRDWEDVYALVHETRYEREEGGDLGIWRAALDTGGTEGDPGAMTRPEEAYAFIRQHGLGRIHAAKGASREQLAPVTWSVVDKMPRSRAPIPGGLTLFRYAPDYFKGLVLARLDGAARQPIRLHRECDESLARQLAAERLERDRTGKLRWIVVDKDNHYLDCMVLNFACAHATWTPSLQQIALRMLEAKDAAPAEAAPAEQANPYVRGGTWR